MEPEARESRAISSGGRASVLGVFAIPKWRVIFSKGILKQGEKVVGRFGNLKRRFSEVGLPVARRMICFHD